MNTSGGAEFQSRINSWMFAGSTFGISASAGAENGVPPYLRTRLAMWSRIRLSRMATVLPFIDAQPEVSFQVYHSASALQGVNFPRTMARARKLMATAMIARFDIRFHLRRSSD